MNIPFCDVYVDYISDILIQKMSSFTKLQSTKKKLYINFFL